MNIRAYGVIFKQATKQYGLKPMKSTGSEPFDAAFVLMV